MTEKKKSCFQRTHLAVVACFVCVGWTAAAEAQTPVNGLDEGIVFRKPQIPATLPVRYRLLNEQLSKGVVPERNAVVYLKLILGRTSPTDASESAMLGVDSFPVRLKHFQTIEEFAGSVAPGRGTRKPLEESLFRSETAAMSRPWDRFDFPDLPDYMKANEAALNRLVPVSQLPSFYSPIVASTDDESLLNRKVDLLAPFTAAGRALVARAMFRAKAGDMPDAFRDLLAARRLSRLACRGAFDLTTMIQASRIDTHCQEAEASLLKLGGLGEAALQYCHDLQKLGPFRSAIDMYENECKWVHPQQMELFRQQVLSEKPTTNSRLLQEFQNRRIENLSLIQWNVVYKTAEELTATFVDVLRLPDSAVQATRLEEIDSERERFMATYDVTMLAFNLSIKEHPREASEWLGKYFGYLFHPGMVNYREMDERRELRRSISVIGFALAGYAAKHNKFPAHLNELSPTILKSVPPDLDPGRNFTMELRMPAAARIYSWGPNRIDDQGRPFSACEGTDDISVEVAIDQ